jgi:hypothetical protein
MTPRRLIIVEGIMGSGKSETTRWIAAQLEAKGRTAQAITERTDPHPVRGTDGLDHWFQPWLDITVTELAERCLQKWRTFVATAQVAETVQVLDGQMFHGDLTHLFLMEADLAAMNRFCNSVANIARPLAPLLVYFHQADVERTIRAVCAERGDEWVKYQVDWKLAFPYSRRRGLEGLEGLIKLYKDYRTLTDELYQGLVMDKIAIDNSAGTWESYYSQIMQRLPAS